MILDKKVMRTFSEHKSRYIGIVILIMISCMLFTAFNQAIPWVQKNIKEFKKDNHVEDANFMLSKPLKNINQIEKKFNLQLEERKTVDYHYNKTSILRLIRETKKLNKYTTTKGSILTNSYDIVIDEEFAIAHNLHFGQKIKIYNKTFTLKGFTSTPDYLYLLNSEKDILIDHETFGIAVISSEAINNMQGLTFYSVKFNKNNSKEFKNYINTSNQLITWTNKEDNMRIIFPENDMNSAAKVAKILPTVILLLTCGFIAMVMWRILKNEFVQLGTLFALGYTKVELLKHYLTYCWILTPIGSILGTIAGLFLEKPFVEIYKQRYNLPVTTITYDFKTIILSLLLPFVFLIPVTVLTILKALKMSPLVLMRGGAKKTKISFIEKHLKLNKFNFKTKFTIRQLTRNIPRALLMIFSTIFASMLLLIYFISTDSVNSLLNSYFDVYHYKYDYVFKSLQTQKNVYGEHQSLASFKAGKNIGFVIYGINEDSKLIILKDFVGEKIKYNQFIMAKTLAKKLGVKQGDFITITNTATNKKSVLKIGKLADIYLGNYAFLPIDKFNKLCNYPKGSYLEILSNKKLHIPNSKLISVTNIKDSSKAFIVLLKALNVTLVTIGLTAFVIGLIVMYVITSMLIEENKTNISLLKILGYPKKQVFSMILSSNKFFVIVGYLLAIPIIMKALAKLFESITQKLSFAIPVVVHISDLCICFVLIFITYAISNVLSKNKINKIPMTDSLKNRGE